MNREALRASIEANCQFEFSRSGGPGGQNVNKVNSKAAARVRLSVLDGLSDAEMARAFSLLSGRLTEGGELIVSASSERDQIRNREAALERLMALVAGAAAIPRRRRPTKPTRASRERRLEGKRRKGAIKQLRGHPESE